MSCSAICRLEGCGRFETADLRDQRTVKMKRKLSAIMLLAILLTHARAATLTDTEAIFLDQLVTAAAVLEQRCTGYEVNGTGGVQYGARLLGSPDAAIAMIDAF